MPHTDILQSLRGIRRRVRLLSMVYGAALVAAAAIALLLASMSLDYLLVLPATPRLVLLMGVGALVGYALWRWIARPATAPLTLGDIAGRLEETFPVFDDRLRSTVNFLDGGVPGSEQMQRQVVAQTTQLAGDLDLGRAIAHRPVLYALGAAGGAVLLMLLLALWSGPQYTSIALARLFAPFAGDVWPRRVNIQLLGEVPQRVPVGQRVDVRMKLSRGDSASVRGIVHYRYGEGPIQQEVMIRGDDGIYGVSLDARLAGGGSDQLRVWVRAGDDTRHLPGITVVPRLSVADAQLRVTPPAYARQEPVTLNLAGAQAVVTRGSQLRLAVRFNKPLDAHRPLRLEPVGTDRPIAADVHYGAEGSQAAAAFVAGASMRFRIIGTDSDGFESSGLEEYEIVVRPDQNPVVQIEQPRRNEERTPQAYVPLRGLAEDDFAIASLVLVVDRLGDKGHWEIPLVVDGQPAGGVAWTQVDGSEQWQRRRAGYQWELGRLHDAHLKPGDVLEYHLSARDNYRLDDQIHPPATSGKLRIAIISQEELADRTADELRQIAQRVHEIRNAQVRLGEETDALRSDTRGKPELDAADRAVTERLAGRQSTLASQSKQTAGKLEEVLRRLEENRSGADEQRQIATDVRDRLSNVAENPMKNAATELNAVREQKQSEPAQRAARLEQAHQSQGQAADALAGALDRMGNIGTLRQMIDRMRDLLEAQRKVADEMRRIGQRNLGKTPEQIGPEDRRQLEELARRQEDLAQRTAGAIEEMNRTAGQMEKSDPADAAAMRQAAQTGQQQQVSANQSRAAEQARRNQQSQAQAAQDQAELGLRMMLGQLHDAERRKLEELSRKLDDLGQQIRRLIQRQAGHNVDNLTLQGPRTGEEASAGMPPELLALADRGSEHPVPALPRLTGAQEQTERNARDIARAVADAPNGAEPAAHLTRAAGKMERAIVALRNRDLRAAYDPSQVEALAALLQAQRIIDRQKSEVDAKRRRQQRESIREVYVKVQQEQQALNEQTAAIEGSRGADGALKRQELVRLGQLPGQQGALGERLQKLQEDLSALGSVAFIWANQDVVATMIQVKQMLEQRQTGAVAQAEQTRIVDQLGAMIRSLEIQAAEPEPFAGAHGGGGGQGAAPQAPRLPAAAELRLIKELQTAVNRSTRTIDAQPERDAAVLAALGRRQGDLRNVLDELLRKASQGGIKLGPEPDNRDLLPEEASAEQVELQELEADLLHDQPTAQKIEKDVSRIGDRMARSRQRLAINRDPGKTTQLIQERILQNLDELIAMSDQQQQSSAQAQAQAPGQVQRMPAPNDGQQQTPGNQGQGQANAGAATPADESRTGPGEQNRTDPSVDIEQRLSEWGGITPRQRQAVIEGAGETVIEKYKRLVDDYYRALATKATERQ